MLIAVNAYKVGVDDIRYLLTGGQLRCTGPGLNDRLGPIPALLAAGPATPWLTPPWVHDATPSTQLTFTL